MDSSLSAQQIHSHKPVSFKINTDTNFGNSIKQKMEILYLLLGLNMIKTAGYGVSEGLLKACQSSAKLNLLIKILLIQALCLLLSIAKTLQIAHLQRVSKQYLLQNLIKFNTHGALRIAILKGLLYLPQ